MVRAKAPYQNLIIMANICDLLKSSDCKDSDIELHRKSQHPGTQVKGPMTIRAPEIKAEMFPLSLTRLL